ncbi:MAG TPA: PEGA domain-containing protein [Pyrinomonadaceae bacterium]|nr:PEGA domain-containing protein [Pyrinomonadaceae bacterium]
MKKSLALVFTLTLLLSAPPAADSQGGSPRYKRVPPRPPRTSPRRTASPRVRTPMELYGEEIMRERPEVSSDTIYDDMEVIEYALPGIKHVFGRRGQGGITAQAYTLAGWKQLRVGRLRPDERLTIELLTSYVTRLGTLVIRSTPAGAKIELDGTPSGITENILYPSPGNYRVRLSLEGFEPVEEVCSVAEGQMTEVNKKLKPRPKPSPRRKTRP